MIIIKPSEMVLKRSGYIGPRSGDKCQTIHSIKRPNVLLNRMSPGEKSASQPSLIMQNLITV